jgi:hypothetical protein
MRLHGVVSVRNVCTYDALHVFDRNEGFIHGPACGACAFCFCVLRMLLCSISTLENAATMNTLISERKYPGVISEAVISVRRMYNMLCKCAHGFKSALASSLFRHKHIAQPWMCDFAFFIGARASHGLVGESCCRDAQWCNISRGGEY